MTGPPSGLRRFAKPTPTTTGQDPPANGSAPSQAARATRTTPAVEAAATTLPPLVADLLQSSAPPPHAAPQSSPEPERCELCNVELPAEHGHLADIDNQTLECACRACYLLFTQNNAAQGRYRAIPDRYLTDPARTLTEAQYDALEIPVGLAFFLTSSKADRTVGFYPSPAGATECVLDLGSWDRLTAEHPLLAEPAADVEAALVSRSGDGIEYFLVPIDACYELVGRMRLQWRGFDGGAEARASITDFLERVRSRARVFESGARP